MLSCPEFKKKQIVLVFANQGDKISFQNDDIVIKNAEGKIKHQSTCYRLFMVMVIGGVSITSGIIERCKKFGFSICLMTQSLKVYHIIGGLAEGNTILHQCQYNYTGIDVGKGIIINKIQNQRKALADFRYKSEMVRDGIELLDAYVERMKSSSLDFYTIMGIEGSAARVYFSNMFNNTRWNVRRPRAKCDYVNTVLDIGYSILFNIIDASLGVYGFDRYYGVFHKCFYMRKSLVCDIMEPFRPIIDKQIRKAINLNQIKESDFIMKNGCWFLPWKLNPYYVSIFVNAVLYYKEDLFMYIQSYYRAVMKEKEAEAYPVFELR